MATNIIDYVKEHPYLIGGAALVAVVGVVIIKSSSGSQTTASYGGINPQLAALYAQNSQTNAQLQANSQNIAGQETLATTQAQYGVDIAQIQSNTQTIGNNDALQASLANIAAQQQTTDTGIAAQLQINQQNDAVSTTGIEAQLAGLESNNQTSLGLATTTANEQTQIAQLQTQVGLAQIAGTVNIADTASNNTTQLGETISNNSTQLGIVESNNTASVLKTQSSNSMIGGIVGSIAGIAAAAL